MLSDDDRRTLRALEGQLAAADAAFVQRFDAAASRPRPTSPGPTSPAGSGPLIQIAGSLVMGLMMLLAESMAGVLACTGAAAAIGLAWWYADQPGTGPHRSSPDHHERLD
jgi:Protein of unknown function (DUF3040)